LAASFGWRQRLSRIRHRKSVWDHGLVGFQIWASSSGSPLVVALPGGGGSLEATVGQA